MSLVATLERPLHKIPLRPLLIRGSGFEIHCRKSVYTTFNLRMFELGFSAADIMVILK